MHYSVDSSETREEKDRGRVVTGAYWVVASDACWSVERNHEIVFVLSRL